FESFDKTFSKVFRDPTSKRWSRVATREKLRAALASVKKKRKIGYEVPNFWLVFQAAQASR
ncbi:MAG: hypothetical protein IJX46_07595, partial [Clostridia bacterium]|nr:hypothetical protein [Clostridia bacterium]